LYEKLDPSNYESGARMVAFRTFHERIVPWIKILNLYYYELMGKQNDKMVSWVDGNLWLQIHGNGYPVLE
jgi:hypothetical protein